MSYFIYTRISSDRKGTAEGVQRQQADCQHLADTLGLDVIEVYTDNDISAYSGADRPAFNAMMERLESGEGEGIITWHADRLYRRSRDLEQLVDLVEHRSLSIRTVSAGDLDLNTATGRAMARIMGSMANFEVDHQRERIKASHVDRAKRGTWRGGPIPIGYLPGVKKGELVINPDEVTDVRFIFDSIANGDSLHSVSRRMNEPYRINRRNGKPWTNVTIRHFVKSPALAGLSKVGEGEFVPAQWEPIIPPEKWHAVQAILSDPGRRTNQGSERRWQGSGVYLCGACGEPLKCKITNKVNYYSCIACHRVSRNQVKLDDLVDRVVLGYLDKPGNRLSLLKGPGPKADLGGLMDERSGLIERKNQLGELFAQGAIDVGQLTRGKAEFDKRLSGVDRRIAVARESSPVLEMLLSADDLKGCWGAMSADKRADVIRELLVVRVDSAGRGAKVFDPSKIRFEWK